MNTTRGLMGAALVGSVLTLAGCGGSAAYVIPDVAPVVKQKPDDNLLDDIEGTDKPATQAAPVATTPETPKAEAPAAPAAEGAKPKPAKK